MRFIPLTALAIAMISAVFANPLPMPAGNDDTPSAVDRRAVASDLPAPVPTTPAADPNIDLAVKNCQKGCKQGYRNCLATGRILLLL